MSCEDQIMEKLGWSALPVWPFYHKSFSNDIDVVTLWCQKWLGGWSDGEGFMIKLSGAVRLQLSLADGDNSWIIATHAHDTSVLRALLVSTNYDVAVLREATWEVIILAFKIGESRCNWGGVVYQPEITWGISLLQDSSLLHVRGQGITRCTSCPSFQLTCPTSKKTRHWYVISCFLGVGFNIAYPVTSLIVAYLGLSPMESRDSSVHWSRRRRTRQGRARCDAAGLGSHAHGSHLRCMFSTGMEELSGNSPRQHVHPAGSLVPCVDYFRGSSRAAGAEHCQDRPG